MQTAKYNVEISQEQAEHLENITDMCKVFAAPSRLTLIGLLSAQPNLQFSMNNLQNLSGLSTNVVMKDLKTLARFNVITVKEWRNWAKYGDVPDEFSFNLDYLKIMPQYIGTLTKVNNQVHPPEKTEPLDERGKVLQHYIKNGRLTGWPAQFKKQEYLVEEVAKLFENGIRYSERDVNAILTEVYEYDYCTLRRYLVDLQHLRRENGIYWKENRMPVSA